MILLSHIIIALSSLLFTAVVLIAPSKVKLRISYALVALTIASGTLLVVTSHVRILEVCTMGLFYLAIVSVGLVFAHRRLAPDA